MKLRRGVVALGLSVTTSASAGGLLVPGVGAKSTARAGAAMVAADDGEALSLNPAGMSKSKGTTITIGFTAINYDMSFQRNGSYDDNPDDSNSYEGSRYPLVENNAKPELGIGSFLPIPAIAIVSDLGGAVPGLHVGGGLYTTNAYPDRNMNYVNGRPYFTIENGTYTFPAFGDPPPPTRYDIIDQTAVIISPAIAASYRVLPQLDIGARFQLGFAHLKSTVAIWGGLANYDEDVKKDGVFNLDAKGTTYGFGVGANFRATPNIEIGLHYNEQMDIQAKGDAVAANGPGVSLNNQPVVVLPVDDDAARCATGGTPEKLKGCAELALPRSATLGARYKFLAADGSEKGDIELDVEWQNWSAQRAGQFRIVVDAKVTPETLPDQGIDLKDNIVEHGLKDTFGVRLGGSWKIPQGANAIVARGGVGYETGAAKTGWERADFDGASRVMITAGGSYKLPRVSIDAGFGYIHQGTRTSSGNCNPALNNMMQEGCGPGNTVQELEDRQGPDPINPLVVPDAQAENPVNQGTYKSHYILFMLGASTWF
jgi:long-subunit fatty acid transport protein